MGDYVGLYGWAQCNYKGGKRVRVRETDWEMLRMLALKMEDRAMSQGMKVS